MKRLTVVGVAILTVAIAVFLITDQLGQSNASEYTLYPATQIEAPLEAVPFDEVLATAEKLAQSDGLRTITSHEAMWTTMGDWLGYLGIPNGIMDPSIPVLVISIAGEGNWVAAGASYATEPRQIDGVTYGFSTEGTLMGSMSNYSSLPFSSTARYTQLNNVPTLEPRKPLLNDPNVIPLPTSVNP